MRKIVTGKVKVAIKGLCVCVCLKDDVTPKQYQWQYCWYEKLAVSKTLGEGGLILSLFLPHSRCLPLSLFLTLPCVFVCL